MENIRTYEVDYLGGHPDWPQPSKINISVRKAQHHVFIEQRGFWSENKKLYIEADKIISVDFDEVKTRSVGKAAAGAVIGGLLTGGIGLLAGGALGASRKDKSNLYIAITYNNREFQVKLKTGKFTNPIYAEICSLFSLKE